MQKQLIEEMFETETIYWWHVAKRKLVLSLMSKKPAKILDVGCGTGAMMIDLKKQGYDVFGVDGSSDSLKFSKSRGLKNIKLANFEKKLPFDSNRFDAIVCLDVLEHIENDRGLLKEFFRILGKNGQVFLTVPAYMALWTYWDEMLGHKRRYRKSDLISKFQAAGFKISFSSYFYSFLLPVAFVFRRIKNSKGSQTSDFVKLPKIMNSLLLLICFFERKLISIFALPFGLSIIVVAKKNG